MIRFNILTPKFAKETIRSIAEMSPNGINAIPEDMLPAIADEAEAYGKWKLDETAFICVEIIEPYGSEPTTWLYKEGWNHLDGNNVTLLYATYDEILAFDEDTSSKQKKFKNYADDDIELALLGWAKRVAAGSKTDDIPITLDVEIPEKRRRKLSPTKHDSNS